ncbi:MAG: hypothetical protein RLZZ130_970, partial [Pseudomonadota bacterium]
MSIELKMPALSPTMEEGTLARWLVKEGDIVSSGDLIAEIETDKATMEFEAVDEGVITQLLVAEGTDGVKVGTVIAIIQGEDDGAIAAPKPAAPLAAQPPKPAVVAAAPAPAPAPAPVTAPVAAPSRSSGERIKASPLAKRIAANSGVDLAAVSGTGPNGRIVKADVERSTKNTVSAELVEARPTADSRPSTGSGLSVDGGDIPHEVVKLSNMRKTIARRLTESKQQVPHIYLTVDVRLDALLK